jgi:4-hydroxy-3-methylbut-2-enyl diphosphate reductase
LANLARAPKLDIAPGRAHKISDMIRGSRMSEKPSLNVFLCAPRGFCAGVVRAIDVVEHALRKFGAPVYVRHEIVHNRYVVEALKRKGAIFVEELDEVPNDGAPVVFSAHGVPKSVPVEAQRRNLLAIDATCPLVTKVHREAEIHFRRGRKVVLVGHKGHTEVIGTMGQLPEGAVVLVESPEDVAALPFADDEPLAYVTQTTLSVDDMAEVVNALQEKYPHIVGPHKQDICYATTNRQEAVKSIAHKVDAFIVVGSPNSSNSQRLKEVAERNGCRHSQLVLRATDIDWRHLEGAATLGVTAGASAPEVLVEEILAAVGEKYELILDTITTATEDVSFPLPRNLREKVA